MSIDVTGKSFTRKAVSIISEGLCLARQKNDRVGISLVSRNEELTVICSSFRHWNEPWKIRDCGHVRSRDRNFQCTIISKMNGETVDNYFSPGVRYHPCVFPFRIKGYVLHRYFITC